MTGKNLAHGASSRLVGKDLIDLKDPDGKPVIKMFVDLAKGKGKGKGWSDDYKFMNLLTQKMQNKTHYLERVGDVFIGTGIYKD